MNLVGRDLYDCIAVCTDQELAMLLENARGMGAECEHALAVAARRRRLVRPSGWAAREYWVSSNRRE